MDAVEVIEKLASKLGDPSVQELNLNGPWARWDGPHSTVFVHTTLCHGLRAVHVSSRVDTDSGEVERIFVVAESTSCAHHASASSAEEAKYATGAAHRAPMKLVASFVAKVTKKADSVRLPDVRNAGTCSAKGHCRWLSFALQANTLVTASYRANERPEIVLRLPRRWGSGIVGRTSMRMAVCPACGGNPNEGVPTRAR